MHFGPHADEQWATIKAAHASEVISGIYVSAGFSAGASRLDSATFA